MGKSIVLAEKPSVGRELAKILHCNQKGNGCFIGPKHIVTWTLGHLVTLADPEAYDDRYKTWNLEDLPMLPAAMELVVIKFIAVLSPPFEYEQTTIKAAIYGETFSAKGKIVKNLGWRRVYEGKRQS